MNKKPTVKDVAREAGVSVATVSYIMNNRTDMKISDQTRKKVLQIANLLNYIPSSAARTLATGRNSIIGVAYKTSDSSPSRSLEITSFANRLIARLNRMKYDVLFMPINATEDNITINRNIDGILAIDLSEQDFSFLADNCLVPIISVDMIINDMLFYQIYSDIPVHIREAVDYTGDDYIVCLEKYSNTNYMNYVIDGIDEAHLAIIDNFYDNVSHIDNSKKKIVIGANLALALRPYMKDEDMVVIASNDTSNLLPASVRVIKNDVSKKANVAINILLNAMDRKFEVTHDHKIL